MKQRLLYLSQGFPYPPDGGGYIKTYNTLTTLAKKYQIQAVFVSEKPAVKAGLKYFQKLGILVTVIPNENVYKSVKENKKWLLSNFLRGKPHYQMQYELPEAFKLIDRLIHDWSPEIIHVDHLNLAPYLPKIKKEVWVLEHHNVETQLYWTRFWHSTPLKRKLYLLAEMVLTYLFEARMLSKFDIIWCISWADSRRIKRLFPINLRLVLEQPLIYPLKHPNRKHKGQGKYVLFCGNTRWPPNEDAVEWFVTKIWPKIVSKLPECEFHVVGQKYELLYDRLPKDKRIYLHNYQADLNQFLKKADVFILPFRMGGGVRLKALTAMAAQIPVVSTKVGVDGLGVLPGKDYLLAQSPKDFALKVLDLLNSDKLRQRVSHHASQYFERIHSLIQNREYLKQYEEQLQRFVEHHKNLE
jgi:polysaccharide biosynthesis protein PslH